MFVLVVFIFGLTLGAGGREFKSLRPDKQNPSSEAYLGNRRV